MDDLNQQEVHRPPSSLLNLAPESQFKEFKPRLKSVRKPVLIERRLRSLNIEYNF